MINFEEAYTLACSTDAFFSHRISLRNPSFCFYFSSTSVFLIVLNREAPFFMPKSAKSAPNFFSKKRHNFGQRRHNLRLFLIGLKLKMPYHTIFIAFLYDNFSQSNANL